MTHLTFISIFLLKILIEVKDEIVPKIRKQFEKGHPDQLEMLEKELHGDRYEQLCRGDYVAVMIFC